CSGSSISSARGPGRSNPGGETDGGFPERNEIRRAPGSRPHDWDRRRLYDATPVRRGSNRHEDRAPGRRSVAPPPRLRAPPPRGAAPWRLQRASALRGAATPLRPDEDGAFFRFLNAGKRSAVLDLDSFD